MKPVENKKYRSKYHPMEISGIDVVIHVCVHPDGSSYGITRHLPLHLFRDGSQLSKVGAEIQVETINLGPKWFKGIRMRKE